MRLKASASSPISVLERTCTRAEKFPAAKAREAAASRSSGVESVCATATAARMARPKIPTAQNSVLCTMDETGR
jgi:hypothetical protein